MNQIFSSQVRIRETHLDTFGHVNHATYLTLLEQARWDLVTENGYGLKEVHHFQQGPTILEVKIQYLKELKNRQTVEIFTQCTQYEGKVGILKHWIENESKERCCEALVTFGLFDMKLRKLVAPTPQWKAAIGLS